MEQYLPYLQWIQHQKEGMISRLQAWSDINTHTLNGAGHAAFRKLLKEELKQFDGEIEELPTEPFSHITEEGKKELLPLSPALRLRKRPHAPHQILFSGHMDTVFPAGSPFQKSHFKDSEILIGPGVADMKGGLLVMLTAISAFEKSPYTENVGWEILLTTDEEIGSPGSQKLLTAAAERADLALVFEPAFADGAIVSERSSSLNLTLIIHGKTAHAGRDFSQGRSAIYAAAPLLQELEKLNSSSIIVNVGTIHSGHVANSVPDLLVSKINIRSRQDVRPVLEKIETIISKLQREGISYELIEGTYRPPKVIDELTEAHLQRYEASANQLGLKLNRRPSGGVSDANIFAACGVPALDTMGPVGGNLHTHEEYVLLESLVERAKLAALFLLEYANKPEKKVITL